MKKNLFIIAFYYFALALFAPNPLGPDEPNQFGVIMIWFSIIFSSIGTTLFLTELLDTAIDVVGGLFTKEPVQQSLDLTGAPVTPQGYQVARVEERGGEV